MKPGGFSGRELVPTMLIAAGLAFGLALRQVTCAGEDQGIEEKSFSELHYHDVPVDAFIRTAVPIQNPMSTAVHYRNIRGTCSCSVNGVARVSLSGRGSTALPMEIDWSGKEGSGVVEVVADPEGVSGSVRLARISVAPNPSRRARALVVDQEQRFVPGSSVEILVAVSDCSEVIETLDESIEVVSGRGDAIAGVLSAKLTEESGQSLGLGPTSRLIRVTVAIWGFRWAPAASLTLRIPTRYSGVYYQAGVVIEFAEGVVVARRGTNVEIRYVKRNGAWNDAGAAESRPGGGNWKVLSGPISVPVDGLTERIAAQRPLVVEFPSGDVQFLVTSDMLRALDSLGEYK